MKTWIEQYAEERSARDPEFKAGYEEERALLALVRARNAAALTQKDVAMPLQILRLQARVLGDSGQHPRPDLLAVVERKDEIGRTRTGEGSM